MENDQPVFSRDGTPSAAPAALHILYRDHYYVAIDKPTGLPVHRRRHCRGTAAVLQQLRDQLGCHLFTVHRLDQATSGVLAFAFSADAAGRLCAQFREHTVEKTYLAVVRGHTEAAGTINHPLRVARDRPLQRAVTHYRRLATCELPFPVGPYAASRYSLVALRIETGRHHQIRKHFHHLRHPVIGDTAHGDSAHNRFFRAKFGTYRLLLTALRLRFTHPYSGCPVEICAELDDDFSRVLTRLGWDPAAAADFRG